MATFEKQCFEGGIHFARCATSRHHNWYFPSCCRRHRGLSGRPGGPRAIHTSVGSSLLGHIGVNFAEAGCHARHAPIRPEERVPGDAETEPRIGLRRPGEAHARTKDLSHVARLLRRHARDQETQARLQQLQEMFERGERVERSG